MAPAQALRALSTLTSRLAAKVLADGRPLMQRLAEGSPQARLCSAWEDCVQDLLSISAVLQECAPSDRQQLWTAWMASPCSGQLLRAFEAVLDGASYQLNPAQSSNTAVIIRLGTCLALSALLEILSLLTRCYKDAWRRWPGTVILHASAGLSVSAGQL